MRLAAARRPGHRAAGPLLSVQRHVRSGWVPGTAALRSWAAAALGARAARSEIALSIVGTALSFYARRIAWRRTPPPADAPFRWDGEAEVVDGTAEEDDDIAWEAGTTPAGETVE